MTAATSTGTLQRTELTCAIDVSHQQGPQQRNREHARRRHLLEVAEWYERPRLAAERGIQNVGLPR
jgi:hypothetical protein